MPHHPKENNWSTDIDFDRLSQRAQAPRQDSPVELEALRQEVAALRDQIGAQRTDRRAGKKGWGCGGCLGVGMAAFGVSFLIAFSLDRLAGGNSGEVSTRAPSASSTPPNHSSRYESRPSIHGGAVVTLSSDRPAAPSLAVIRHAVDSATTGDDRGITEAVVAGLVILSRGTKVRVLSDHDRGFLVRYWRVRVESGTHSGKALWMLEEHMR